MIMVCIILGKGFEEIEAAAPCDILRRGGVDVYFAGIGGTEIEGSHGIVYKADMTLEEAAKRESDIDLIVVPGGLGGVESIENSPEAMRLISEVFERTGRAAAICAGPRVLGKLGILKDRSAVCYPGMESEINCRDTHPEKHVVFSDDVVTGRGPGSALHFGFALLKLLKGEKTASDVKKAMYFED